jgi:hypothetical protein
VGGRLDPEKSILTVTFTGSSQAPGQFALFARDEEEAEWINVPPFEGQVLVNFNVRRRKTE